MFPLVVNTSTYELAKWIAHMLPVPSASLNVAIAWNDIIESMLPLHRYNVVPVANAMLLLMLL